MSDVFIAKIIRSSQRVFDCLMMESRQVVSAIAEGNLLKKGQQLVVGDDVILEQVGESEFKVLDLKERKNAITRFIQREQKKKLIAANCDLLAITVSSHKPKYKQGLVDRYLVRAFEWGIEPILIFNKIDLYDSKKLDLSFEQKRLERLGVKCYEVCAKDKDFKPVLGQRGYFDLKEYMTKKTVILMGQSGVGKSKLITALSDGKVNLKSRELAKVGKGSHTTTWAELIDCDNFELIDSPGIRAFSLNDIKEEDLLSLMPDVEEVAITCKFTNCEHFPESKGCSFYSGIHNNEFVHSRLEAYLRIREELSAIPSWQK